MNKKRYELIDSGYAPLTDDEIEEGWHFCADWDFMLIGPGMPEFNEGCLCFKEVNNLK